MNKPIFERVTNVITLNCNLNCQLCVICSPYYEKPWHPTLDYINLVTDKLFEIADYNIFDLTGGEPLIRKDLPLILEHMLRYKNNVLKRFGFQSNGSIPVNKDLLHILKKFGEKIEIIMDNYGENLSPYSENNYNILKSEGIPVEIRTQYAGNAHCDGWVDYISKGTVKNSDIEAKKLFSKCAQPQIMGFCATVVEGQVMPCPVMYPLKKLYNINPLQEEYIDIFDTKESIEEKRTKWSNIYQLNVLEACKSCNGLCKDSKRYIPGIQLTKEKIEMER